LIEAERSSNELSELGINNQVLVINGILSEATDDVSIKMLDKQQKALENMPQGLKKFKIFTIPLRSYNVVGIDNIRTFLYSDEYTKNSIYSKSLNLRNLDVLIEDIYRAGKKVIFTMGKGGVGKTTIAAPLLWLLLERVLRYI